MTKITQKPDGSISFELIIPKETIAKEYAHALSEVAKTTQIKGFRVGKAPIKLVESQTDKSRLYNHVLDHVLSPAYSEVIHEHKLIPLIDPHVNPKSMSEGKDWVMSFEVSIAPTFELGDFEKIVKSALKKHDAEHKPDPKETKEKLYDHKLNVVFDKLLEKIKFDISPLLIEEEAKNSLTRLAQQLSSLKISIADYAKSIKKSTEDLVAEYKKTAETNLRLEFILQQIIKKIDPDVTESEIAGLKPQKGQEAYAKYILQKRKILDKLIEL